MSATKILNFDKYHEKSLTPIAANMALVDDRRGIVIDRRDFRHWMKKAPTRHIRANNRKHLEEHFDQILERVDRIKTAHSNGNWSEIVTLSARIAVLSKHLDLPRTANLAYEIGEAQMVGDTETVDLLLQKLDNIINALNNDLRSNG